MQHTFAGLAIKLVSTFCRDLKIPIISRAGKKFAEK
jgi:hypothetical protein